MRKIISAIFAIIFIGSVLTSCSDQKKKVLYIYNWNNYISQDLVEKFEKIYNCKVIIDYFDCNESMYAKLKIYDPGYDIIIPSSYIASVMYDEHMIIKLDKSKIPNLKYIDKKYSTKAQDPNMLYSVPWAICFAGICYNDQDIKNIKHSWSVFGDKKYYHRISLFNDMRMAIGSALKYLGYSVNSTDNRQLAAAKELMLAWKNNIAAYQNDDAKGSLSTGILDIIQAYSGDGIQLHQGNPNLKFFVPEEGTPIQMDMMVISSTAKEPELAYKFINFIYEPKNCAEHMKGIDYLCPNIEAIKLLSPEFVKEISVPDAILSKSEVIQDLGKDNEKYLKIWNAVRN